MDIDTRENRRFRFHYTLLSYLTKEYDNPITFAIYATTSSYSIKLALMKRMVIETGKKVDRKKDLDYLLINFYGDKYTDLEKKFYKFEALHRAVPKDIFCAPYIEDLEEFIDFWILAQVIYDF